MSPGSSVISFDRCATSAGTEWTRSAVRCSCISSPFSVSAISIASWAPASSGVTSAGPHGAEPSKTLPGIHCGVCELESRAERSLKQRVAGHVVQRLGLGTSLQRVADHERDLGLVVHLWLDAGSVTSRPGAASALANLAKNVGRLGRLRALLGGVGAVVEPDADDLRGVARSAGSSVTSSRSTPSAAARARRAARGAGARRARPRRARSTATTSPSRRRPRGGPARRRR